MLGVVAAAALLLRLDVLAAEPPLAEDPLRGSLQLVVARAQTWDSTTGELRRFTRESADAPWMSVDETPIPVVFGRRGLAWGRGLHAPRKGKGAMKREGDGRAPAGVFALTGLFGYASTLPGADLPYRPSTNRDVCVDDTASKDYNRVVRREGKPEWKSAERMRRKDPLYEIGAFVDHNGLSSGRREPGAGSCIFLHVWRSGEKGTNGCTAMNRNAMESIATWLRASASPRYVLLPAREYDSLTGAWGLPKWS
ncbi:MAG: hypothetical protein IPK13_25000 [Deltaproteobacteria bacterium]|nr:hypothetical protein [Deltaproteobacteria bacterium]